jgi:hypothetical protein
MTEHLTDEQMLDLIAGTQAEGETEAIAHLADCDNCRANFSDWLRSITPNQTPDRIKVDVRFIDLTAKNQ